MPHIVFSLAEPRVLVIAVLCAAITGYLLTLRDKTRDLPYLLGAFLCWTIYFAMVLVAEATYPYSQWSRIGQICVGLMGLTLFIGFSYRFLGNPYPRESKIVLFLAIAVVLGTSSFLSIEKWMNRPLSWPIGSGSSLLLFVLAESVFVRRWIFAKGRQSGRPYREFACVFLLSVAAVSLYFLRDLGIVPASAVPLLSNLLYLSTLVGFTLIYVNHSPRPTTFQVKIVGVSLFTMLAVLTVMWTALAPVPTGVSLGSGTAMRLTPKDKETYQVNPVATAYDADLGTRLPMNGDLERQVTLAWPVRFYNSTTQRVRIGRSGVVRFSEMPLYEVADWPSMGPFVTPINFEPGRADVYLKQDTGRILITWKCSTHAVQLALYRAGHMEFVYGHTGFARKRGQRGIFPGGAVRLSDAKATSLLLQREGHVLIEDFDLHSRLEAQGSIVRSIYSILGAALFILVFFPIFFRVSLVQPLESLLQGIDRVDEGRHNVQVPVKFNDEIGRLTSNFNRMTRSLSAAQEELLSYAKDLEVKVNERTAELARKNEENERLLLNILPATIAERLKRGESTIADACNATTILFADIVNFTELSTRIPASELVEMLSGLISEFDDLAEKYGVEKIKVIGDAYMAVAGLPDARHDHAQAAMRLAVAMMEAAERYVTRSGHRLQLRIGMDSGPVIAGVIGTRKFAYDLWGDAVNTASRMESHGRPGRIQVTENTYNLLRHDCAFDACAQVEVKGKGRMSTYLVARPGGAKVAAA